MKAKPQNTAGDDRRGFVLTKRDKAVLAIFDAVRFASTHQFHRLLIPSYFKTPQAYSMRINALARAGYVTELRSTLARGLRGTPAAAHRPEKVWALTTKGARVIDLKADFDKNNRRLRSSTSLEHGLLIAEVFSLLVRMWRETGVELASWDPENTVQIPVRYTVGGERRSRTLRPDATFRLRRDGKERLYYLEADCGTEPLTRTTRTGTDIAKKLEAYHAHWLSVGAKPVPWVVLIVTGREARSRLVARGRTGRRPEGKGSWYLLWDQYGALVGHTGSLLL